MNKAEFVLLTGLAYCAICGFFVLVPRFLAVMLENRRESDSE